MNLFILSWLVHEAARFHCDKHVVKMIVEATQLLYSAHHVLHTPVRPDWASALVPAHLKAYRASHVNHPCSIWIRQCRANYMFAVDLGLALCQEYTRRFSRSLSAVSSSSVSWQAFAASSSSASSSLSTTKASSATPCAPSLQRKHSAEAHLRWLSANPPPFPQETELMPMTPPALAMPLQFKVEGDAVESYRRYYRGAKQHLLSYKYSDPPEWLDAEALQRIRAERSQCQLRIEETLRRKREREEKQKAMKEQSEKKIQGKKIKVELKVEERVEVERKSSSHSRRRSKEPSQLQEYGETQATLFKDVDCEPVKLCVIVVVMRFSG
ncbi:39S ribosomal protein L22, mitochondrial [Balamuthia mandrillaris]